MRKIATAFVAAAFSVLALVSPASAQSTYPQYLSQGFVPTPGQWQWMFSQKQDTLGYVPVNKAGDVMLGKFATTPATNLQAGFAVQPGSAPVSPKNGDMWVTTAGLYVQINGATVGPLVSSASASFAATAPLAVSFPSGVTTYALNKDATLKVTTGNLGIDTTHANTWTNQTLTAPVISAPAFSGTATGTLTGLGLAAPAFSGTATGSLTSLSLTTPTIATPTFSGTASGSLTGLSLTTPAVASPAFSGTATGTLAGLTATAPTISSPAFSGTATGSLAGMTLASPTFSGTVAGAATVPNSVLVNSSMTVNGTTCTLGSSCAPAPASVTSIDSQNGAFTTGNGIDSSGKVIELTAARRTLPTSQSFLTGGGSGTYTTPANVLWIEVVLVGGGGGGAGNGTSPGTATAGGSTCWNTSGSACTTPLYSAGGGGAATSGSGPGAGGTTSGASTCFQAIGGSGGGPLGVVDGAGASGGASARGGVGSGGIASGGAGGNAASNSGSGGGGAGGASPQRGQPSGGSGAFCTFRINAPASTYTYTTGASGSGGSAGSGGSGGGNGATGGIWVVEYYNS